MLSSSRCSAALPRLPSNNSRLIPQVRAGAARAQPRVIRAVVFAEPSFSSITAKDIIKGLFFLGLATAAITVACTVGYEVGGANLTVIMGVFTACAVAHLLGPESNPQLG